MELIFAIVLENKFPSAVSSRHVAKLFIDLFARDSLKHIDKIWKMLICREINEAKFQQVFFAARCAIIKSLIGVDLRRSSH
jgi:hypothetical protein